MGGHGQSSWHTHSLQLPLTGKVLCADVAADNDSTLRVIASTDDNRKAMHVMRISGDPTLGEAHRNSATMRQSKYKCLMHLLVIRSSAPFNNQVQTRDDNALTSAVLIVSGMFLTSVLNSVSLLQGQRRYYRLSQTIHHLALQMLCAVACRALLDQVLGFNPLPITHCTTDLQNPNGTLLRGPSP